MKKSKKRLDQDTIRNIVVAAVKGAVDHIESDIAPSRLRAQEYFNGETKLPYEAGRSGVVSTKVRDTVRAIKPSLMRIFMSSGRYVEYVPKTEADNEFSTQATEYMHYKMEELGGFKILSDVFHDALVKKVGIAKVYYEEYTEAETQTFSGVTDDQLTMLTAEEGVEIVEKELGPNGWEVTASRQSEKGDICVDTMPPEEFFIDENARSIEDFYVVGHRTDMRLGDLVGMGYNLDDVQDMYGTTETSVADGGEDEARRGYEADGDEASSDPSMRRIMVTEAYMRMDIDGTGVPALHKFLLGGAGYELIDHEPWDDAPFAVFEIDPEPHTFWGRCIADLIADDQDASTSMLRGMLDNIALVNDPRTEVVEHNVDLDDLLNNEIGAIVRVRERGSITPLVTPFVAGQTLGAVQYYDSTIDSKTGITKASAGLDPDALQSTTRAGVNATIQAAAGQTEVMARNLAEGGVTQMFKLMLKLIVKHADEPKAMRMNGTFEDVDPKTWNNSMDVSVNVGLGTGQQEEKAMAYRELLGLQMQVLQGYGPQNGIVSLSNITNTVTDMMATVGIRNASRYFKQLTPEQEQQLMQAQAQQAQGQPQGFDPNQGIVMGEQIKAQAKTQTDSMKAQVDMQKAFMDDDLQRDKMAQDLAVKTADLAGKYGVGIDEAALRREQERDRSI